MKIVVASIAFAIGQIAFMLVLVKILGTVSYGIYSLYFTIATAISAFCCEWVRLILARYSGFRGFRLRGVILKTSLLWVGACAAAAIGMSVLASFIALFVSAPGIASAIISTGALTASAMLGDSVATFLRFNRTPQNYINYLAARVLISGTLMLLGAILFRSATVSAVGFSIGVLSVAIVSTLLHWLPSSGRPSYRRMRRFIRVGWAMATGTIGTNATLALTRVVLKNALPPHAAGAVFLALDLSTRGFNMLGLAFNTWAAKGLYDAAHEGSHKEVEVVINRTSSLATSMWLSFGVGGGAVAIAAPIVLAGRNAYIGYENVAIANVLAMMLLIIRIFNFDTIMNAISRYRVVAVASVSVTMPLLITFVNISTALFVLCVGVALSYGIIYSVGFRIRALRRALIDNMLVILSALLVFPWSFRIAVRPTMLLGAEGVGFGLFTVGLIVVLLRSASRGGEIKQSSPPY